MTEQKCNHECILPIIIGCCSICGDDINDN